MARVRIYPYKQGSKSAAALATSLGVLNLKLEGSRFRPRRGDVVINWGNSNQSQWHNGLGTIINSPAAVAVARDKLSAFKQMAQHNVSTLEWTDSKTKAQSWTAEGDTVYCRRVLSGHSGVGIVISTNTENVVDAQLYTKNSKAKYEYRVHVMAGDVIDYQMKRKKEGFEGGVSGIRNLANGWVFCREGVVLPQVVSEQAIKAVAALGLDFGAVDIGYRERDNMVFVYEVNTAPGLEGTTLERYTSAIKENYCA